MSSTTDVVIVGGGPVGMILAAYLAQADLSVTVLEREAEINMAPRAMVYFGGALEVLDGIGVVDEMLVRGLRDDDGLQMVVHKTGDRLSIPNTALVGIRPFPFNIHLGQGEVVKIIDEKLAGLPNARVVRGAEFTGYEEDADGVTASFTRDGEPHTIRARYLVGADGGQSAVRHAIGATLDGTTWDERFVATNVHYDFAALGFKQANFNLDSDVGCIIAKIDEAGFWRCTYQESQELDEFTVADRAPAFFVRLLGAEEAAKVKIDAVRPYRMHQRIASKLRSGRVVLAGDAAHLTNPTGGLGLTSGIFDIEVLQEALVAIIQHGADDTLLDRYAQLRSSAFTGFASPRATEFKGLVYDAPAEVQAAAVAGMSQMTASLEGQRAFLTGNDAMRSASLLAGGDTVAPHDALTDAVTVKRGSFWIPGEIISTPTGTVQRGQMHVEWESAETVTQPYPLILVHGGGGQSTDWKRTVDGRPGWIDGFVKAGFAVYTVDRPGHGRSPYHPAVLGDPGPQAGFESTVGVFLTPDFAEAQTQWPWDRTPTAPEVQQLWASSGFVSADFAAQQEIEGRRLAELLDRTGSAILVTHSLGAGAGWLAANQRPGAVVAIAAIEPFGPPFAEYPGIALTWGLTAAAPRTEPPVDSPQELASGASITVPGWDVPIGVFAAEASPIGLAAAPIVAFLNARGGRAEAVPFAEADVHGNGHAVMLERNSDEAIVPVIDWIVAAAAR